TSGIGQAMPSVVSPSPMSGMPMVVSPSLVLVSVLDVSAWVEVSLVLPSSGREPGSVQPASPRLARARGQNTAWNVVLQAISSCLPTWDDIHPHDGSASPMGGLA